ncbi:hypothetical protein SB780_41280, partial [Burkholderia sp. SIMBA_057]
ALGTTGAGAALDLSGEKALPTAIRAWLTDPSLQQHWRNAARTARQELQGWDATGAVVAKAVMALAR